MTSKKYFGKLSKEEQLNALKSKEVKAKVLDYLSTEIIENLETDLTTHHTLFIKIDLDNERSQFNLKLKDNISQQDAYGTMFGLVHSYLPSLGHYGDENKAIQMALNALELGPNEFAKVYESLMDLLLGILNLDLTALLLNNDNIVNAYQDSLMDMTLEGIEWEVFEEYFLSVEADSIEGARAYLGYNASFQALEYITSKEAKASGYKVVYFFRAVTSNIDGLLSVGDITVYKKIN